MLKKLDIADEKPSFSNPVLSSLSEILSLKFLFRQGWLQKGLSKGLCESVADHSFSTAMMAWILAMEYFPELDASKVLQLAIMHEIGEIYAGDITPSDAISNSDKHNLEKDSVYKVLEKLSKGSHLIAIWDEFETGNTLEADFVRQIDKLEMSFQALHYEAATGMDVHTFIESTDKVITSEKLREIWQEVLGARCK